MRIRALAFVVAVVSSAPALGAGVGLGLGASLIGCKQKKSPAFSCERYQERMERCEHYVVAAAKRRFDTDVKTGDVGASEAAAQVKMLQLRIRKRIRYKNSLRRCRKLQKLRTPRQRKQYSTLKYCLGRLGCVAFGQCMLGYW